MKFNFFTLRSYNLGKSIILSICLLLISLNTVSGQETLAEKLGYKKDAKLLIIHADDLGFSHAENMASIKALDSGSVNSASIMMPTPWVSEIVSYAKKNEGRHDLGLHLTITSEWKNYKWSSVASKDKIPTLINNLGYFYNDCPSDARIAEVETELRAQIELAYAMGIKPTHLDSHMGCLFWGKVDFFEVYLKLAKEFKLPCLIDKTFVSLFDDEEAFNKMLKANKAMVVIDQNFTISEEENAKDVAQYYIRTIKSLEPGLSQILIHTAYDNEEMQAITIEHPSWGAAWRQADFDFFTSDVCKNLIKEEEIVLVTWREIAEVLKN